MCGSRLSEVEGAGQQLKECGAGLGSGGGEFGEAHGGDGGALADGGDGADGGFGREAVGRGVRGFGVGGAIEDVVIEVDVDGAVGGEGLGERIGVGFDGSDGVEGEGMLIDAGLLTGVREAEAGEVDL